VVIFNPLPPSDAVQKQRKNIQRIFSVLSKYFGLLWVNDRPTFIHISVKLSPRPFDWNGWTRAYLEKESKICTTPFYSKTGNRNWTAGLSFLLCIIVISGCSFNSTHFFSIVKKGMKLRRGKKTGKNGGGCEYLIICCANKNQLYVTMRIHWFCY